ncbi:hypothetical protein D3C77_749610 [compost metagenome]
MQNAHLYHILRQRNHALMTQQVRAVTVFTNDMYLPTKIEQLRRGSMSQKL